MDEGVADGVAPVDGIYLQAKEGDYVAKAAGASILGSHEMIIPTRGDYHGGNNSDIGYASQRPHSSANCSDDAGVMVEELTLRNYNGENLAIVGTSNDRDGLQTRMNQWQPLYQMAGGFGSDKDCGQVTSNAWQDNGNTVFPELLSENPHDGVKNEEMEHPQNTENKALTRNMSITSAGIRTKILSRSGFSEYFVKNTLKGKGIVCKGPAHKGFGAQFRSQSNLNAAGAATVSDAPLSSSSKTHVSSSNVIAGPRMGLCPNAYHDGIKLREWLKDGRRKSNKVERLYIFKQIVDLVDQSHSQGLALQDLRPSYFNLLSSNQIVYLGSFVREESVETQRFRDNAFSENNQNEKRPLEQLMHPIVNQLVKKQKFGENQKFIGQGLQFASRSGFKSVLGNCVAGSRDSLDELDRKNYPNSKFTNHSDSSNYYAAIASQQLSFCASDPLEEAWYTSPEERCVKGCSFSSNIYVLGVLLFELLGCFDTESARAAAMSDLHHRILPPNFLSENPKEAGFCLWLLHPGPSLRPTAREVLRSDVISGIEESFGHELSSSIDEDDTESELLLHFLISMKGQKHKDSVKLVEEIKCLEADIEEVEKRRTGKPFDISFSSKEPFNAKGDLPLYNEHSSFEVNPEIIQGTSNEYMFVKNISQLESAYFSMRSNIQISDNDTATRTNSDLLKERDIGCQTQRDEEKRKPIDPVGAFFSGLCKYARYSKFEVRGILRNGEFHNSANVVCSMSFDRDREYFAAAGISKRIKIFEFQALFNEAVDVHYPVLEMPNKSRLSCVCWNSYIRNYLASTDYDGTVKLWDAGTGQVVSQYIEHNKRAWSVDFSQVDPTKLASGSDDYSVKLWSINERNSLCTIKSIANACCVQFSGHSSHLVAFGSSDYKTYCYDLRNVSSPWCILAGHDRAVSFVKFLDSQTLVSASTDNTLKLWDLNKTSSSGLSTSACISTFKGHTNEKNFVGLSVADGYIACGSETNEVYAYYRSLPMPITSHKFGSIDPISGKETDDDNGQFVSSVCWRQNSDMLLAANSSGCIKVLQMV